MKINLLKAIRIVSTVDSQKARSVATMATVMKNNFPMRVAVGFYNKLKKSPLAFLSTLMIAGFGYLVGFTARFPGDAEKSIVAMTTFANETRQMDHVKKWIPRIDIRFVQRSKMCLFMPGNLLSMAALFPRYWRIIHRINMRYDFFPSARTAQAIGYYFSFAKILQRTKCKAVLVASSYSPDALGLSLAAKTCGIPSIFIPHAFYGVRDYVPDIGFDVSILRGPVELDLYKGTPLPEGRIVYSGVEGPYRPMQLADLKPSGMSIGIFLTGTLIEEALEQYIADLIKNFSPSKILIRQHPVTLVHHDLTWLALKYPGIEITKGTRLVDDALRCQLIASGNSGAPLEVMRFGVPMLFMPETDKFPRDLNGFIKAGIMMAPARLSDIDINDISAFYDAEWINKFKYFDATYAMTPEEIAADIRAAIYDVTGTKG